MRRAVALLLAVLLPSVNAVTVLTAGKQAFSSGPTRPSSALAGTARSRPSRRTCSGGAVTKRQIGRTQRDAARRVDR